MCASSGGGGLPPPPEHGAPVGSASIWIGLTGLQSWKNVRRGNLAVWEGDRSRCVLFRATKMEIPDWGRLE